MQREEQALGEQLTDHPRPPGAQRRAHRELAAPLRASRQQQVGDVDAGDRQHQQHRADYGERAPACTPLRDVVLQRAHKKPSLQGRPWRTDELGDGRLRDRVELPRCPARDRNPGGSAADHAQVVAPLPTLGGSDRVVLQAASRFRPPARARSRTPAA